MENYDMTIPVIDVARYFIEKNTESGNPPMTEEKLHILCYYAQAYSLAIYGTPLFLEEIEAWGDDQLGILQHEIK